MAELSRGRYVLYKALNAVFELRLSLERRKLMHVDGWVPVDYFDCRALSGRCSTSPQGLGAFIYVEGRVEGSEIRLNAINLLRMVDLVRPSTSAELLGALRDLLWGRGVERGLDLLLRLTNVDTVRLVLPRAPGTVKDLLTMSPALRQALAKLVRLVDYAKKPLLDTLYDRFSGLGITQAQINDALVKLDLDKKPLGKWSGDDIKGFVSMLRELSKPMVIAANKMDIPEAEDNYKRVVKEVGNRYKIIPTSADYELALRRASKANLVKYIPGDDDFEIISSNLSKAQKDALEKIKDFMHRWGGTGIMKALNTAVFDVLGMIAVYPVADERRFTDTEGNVLPDVLLLPKDATVLDLARAIHSEIAEKAVTGVDAISGRRLGVNSRLWHRAVVRIYVSR